MGRIKEHKKISKKVKTIMLEDVKFLISTKFTDSSEADFLFCNIDCDKPSRSISSDDLEGRPCIFHKSTLDQIQFERCNTCEHRPETVAKRIKRIIELETKESVW